MANELVSIIQESASGFNNVLSTDLDFKQEAFFALQILEANNYSAGIARSNPKSVKNAIKNIATIGLSLNPAMGFCYLVPRKNAIYADISYKGLCKLATDSGFILWLQARVVYENDEFCLNGIDEKPYHKAANEFSGRGKFVGAYCVAKTKDGDYLTKAMSSEDIFDIRDRSEAYKAYIKKGTKCPWVTDESEMILKTVVKSATKMLPKSDRLDKAVAVINEHDGIDFTKPVLASVESIEEIGLILENIDNGMERLQRYVKSVYGRDISSIEEIRADESEALIKVLKEIATKEAENED